MTGWGKNDWGFGAWGGEGVLNTLEPPLPSEETPVIIRRVPYSGQLDVLEDSVISVSFFDYEYDIDPSETRIYVDGVLVYAGNTGFHNGYRGRASYTTGILMIELLRIPGFNFNQHVTLTAKAQDVGLNSCTDSWTFTVRDNPEIYAGLSVLPIEKALQIPFDTFLDLEFLRTVLFNVCLRGQIKSTPNRNNKAARVINQLAFATELSTLQNPFGTRDTAALAVTVREKQNIRLIADALDAYKPQITSAINAFSTLKVLNASYIQSFHDYADSSLYIYRASLVANMLLFAKSTELLP